ncbi:nuclear transport factor 2 family protein [Novosphingobium sp. RD2P27]|uniref:Nuclear transport factor 2 family protein n=1 Tax=Novosphingobium kalidii TaxID=3230299 RepID=A0ABV2D141_9SPHN
MIVDEELEKLRATVRHLKDRQDILDCIQRESRARDRQDVEMIASCWWEDGVDEHGAIITAAPDYPERANFGHRRGFLQTSHNITNHLCELDGDIAHCESYVIGGLAWKHGKRTSIAFGRYLDRMERRGDEWRILTRRCTIEMTCDGDAEWVNSDAIKGFLKGLWSRKDPSYERPFVARDTNEGVRW